MLAAGSALWPPLPDTQGPLGGERLQAGRFTVVAEPRDGRLARSLLAAAVATDTFPWLPRPVERVLIVVAPDRQRFRELVGPGAPEYGAAIAIPSERRIVMQGSRAASDAGDPLQVLRHELAHLALHERLGNIPPRWFDEGYASVAAGEWGREEILATNVVLALRGMPSLDSLETRFIGGAEQASAAYALAHRAVVELAALDPSRGLSLFFDYWRQTGELDPAIRQAFGITQAAFEGRWREHTQRRYGALALFADITIGALVLLFFITPLYVVRRRRDRRRLATMVRAERDADQRERDQAIEELLRSVGPPRQDDAPGSTTADT
jgi:hypothetical protein